MSLCLWLGRRPTLRVHSARVRTLMGFGLFVLAFFASASSPSDSWGEPSGEARRASEGSGFEGSAEDFSDRERSIERFRDARPEERREMRRRLRERRQKATPDQRRRGLRRQRVLKKHLPDFSSIDRMILLRAARDLPKNQRRSLLDRVRRIDDLPPEQRGALVSELKGLIEGYSGDRERLGRNERRWKRLSAEERGKYREQMKRLRSMSLEERRLLLEQMEKAKAAD